MDWSDAFAGFAVGFSLCNIINVLINRRYK